MKSATFLSPLPRLWWIAFAVLSMFLHNVIACTNLWNVAVTDNCLLDMAYTCPENFANYVRQSPRKFWARHRRQAVKATTIAGKRLPGSTNTTTSPSARPTYAPDEKGTCKDIQVIDYRNHVFLVKREDDTDISVAVFKHEWTIRTENGKTIMNAKPIKLKKGVDGQSPDTSYDQILGGIRDQGKKAPCAFSNSSFHAFIDYHTLYVTVECSTQNGSQYALMRSVVYMLPETGEIMIVTPPQELIYLDTTFANPRDHRLASVYAPNNFETVGDALLISYSRDNNDKKKLILNVVELHSVNDTSGHLNVSLTRDIGNAEWRSTQIVNIQHDDGPNRVAFAVIYGEVGKRTSDFFVLPDPKVTRPAGEKLQQVTKNFKLQPLKNFASLPMEQYVYYGVHPPTPKLESLTFTNLTLHIGPELSPFHWTESFDQFVCEISNADVNKCESKRAYKKKINLLLIILGAWELLAILVFIVLFIIGIWLQRRRNTKKRGAKKGKKNRKGAKGKDANNNDTKADTTEATTNNDKTTDASTVATVDTTKREQQPDEAATEKTAKSSQEKVEKKKENAKSDDIPPELRSNNPDNQKTK